MATNNATGFPILDEDDMASNSATSLATQQSIKQYVDGSIDIQLVAEFDTLSIPNVDLTNLSNDNIAYKFIFSNVIPATDGTSLQGRLSTDNGSTYISTSSYSYRITYFQGAATLDNSSSSATAIAYNVATGNTTGEGVSGEIMLLAPNFGTYTKVISQLQYTDSSSNFTNVIQSAQLSASQAHNAIRFNFASGNFASGFIRVYAIRKAL